MFEAKTLLLYSLIAVAVCLYPQAAHAQFSFLTCNSGTVVPGTALFDAVIDSGEGACQFRGIEHIFSTVLCDFLSILNATLSKLYCSMQYFLVEVLRLVMTIYVAVFGWQLFMGTAQLNLRDVMMRLFKIALVWTFATQARYGIGVMFYAVLAVMSDASGWVVNAIASFVSLDGCDAIDFSSNDYATFFQFLDCLVWLSFVGPMQVGSIKLLGLLIAMAFVYPPLTGLALWWLSKTFMTMTRAVISFLMALAATAFLISLSPIFLSFALFQATSEHFNNWLRYIISYVIQIVLVFAIVVMWLMVFLQFIWFFEQLSDLIFSYEPVIERVGDVSPTNAWSICPPEYDVDPVSGAPTAYCPPGFWPYQFFLDGSRNLALSADGSKFQWQVDAENLVMPTKIILDGEFLYYVFYHLVSLIIITYAFSVILDNTPTISQSIAQPAALPQLLRRFGNDGFGTTGNMLSPLSNRRPIMGGGGGGVGSTLVGGGGGGAGAPIGRAGGKR